MITTDQVTKVTNDVMHARIVNDILSPYPTYMNRLFGSDESMEITWRDRLAWKLRGIKRYLNLLREALTNTHECDTNEWD